MSISRLSNHLYVVVTTIISLLVAPSTFHQARASPGSHDFTESRQFKKNLAVSKYRENPHWMPNYTWKPPEKFYGPRKRPAWEADSITESKDNRKEQEELEEWDKKMRDVSNRQREKWKTYETIEESESKIAEKDLMPTAEFSDHTSEKEDIKKNATTTEKDVQGTFTGASDGWNKNLHNGRWGMSVAEPAVADFFTDSPRSLEKTNSVSQADEGINLPAMISNGRWGMSVMEAPKEFSKELSRRSQTLKIPDRVWKQDGNPKSTGNRKIHDRLEVRVKEVNVAAEPTATKLSKVFPSGRWGMSSDLPPRELLREISTRGLAGIPEFYGPKTVHQRAHGIVKNNPQSREFIFSQMPGISNVVLLQPFPSIILVPMFPSYLMMDPRIWPSLPNYNVALFSSIISQSEFP